MHLALSAGQVFEHTVAAGGIIAAVLSAWWASRAKKSEVQIQGKAQEIDMLTAASASWKDFGVRVEERLAECEKDREADRKQIKELRDLIEERDGRAT